MWLSRSVNIAESSREVVKDVAKGSLHASAEAILSPDTLFHGQIRNWVKADRSTYSKLRRRSHSYIHKILYCQSGLSNDITKSFIQGLGGSASSSSNAAASSSRGAKINPKSIINHEFLVVVMQIKGKGHAILAEKCGSGGECGISIRSIRESEMGDFEAAQVSEFDCENTRMSLEDMLEILEDHDPNYSVQEKNCWEYAVHTTQRLLMACQRETGKVHFAEQAKLVGSKVTVNHLREMASRGVKVLLDALI